jgi:Flp pilus assembly protein TadD
LGAARFVDCPVVFQEKGRVSTRSWRRFVAVALTLGGLRLGCATPSVHPDAVVHHNAGVEYLRGGSCEPAEQRCRLALEYGEHFAHPHNCLGLVALHCGDDPGRAAQHFRDALSRDDEFAEAHNNLGVTFMRARPPDYDAACERFEAALAIDPRFVDARENLGSCRMRQGVMRGETGDLAARRRAFTEARSHLLRLVELDPDNANAQHYLGYIDLLSGRYDVAERRFRRCLELDPDHRFCSYNRGVLYLRTARCDDAVAAFVDVLRGPERNEVSVSARHNLAVAYATCAEEDAALKAQLPDLRRRPDDPEPHVALGRLYARAGKSEQAMRVWQRATTLDPAYCPAYAELIRGQRAEGGDPAPFCLALRDCLRDPRHPRPDAEDWRALCEPFD